MWPCRRSPTQSLPRRLSWEEPGGLDGAARQGAMRPARMVLVSHEETRSTYAVIGDSGDLGPVEGVRRRLWRGEGRWSRAVLGVDRAREPDAEPAAHTCRLAVPSSVLISSGTRCGGPAELIGGGRPERFPPRRRAAREPSGNRVGAGVGPLASPSHARAPIRPCRSRARGPRRRSASRRVPSPPGPRRCLAMWKSSGWDRHACAPKKRVPPPTVMAVLCTHTSWAATASSSIRRDHRAGVAIGADPRRHEWATDGCGGGPSPRHPGRPTLSPARPRGPTHRPPTARGQQRRRRHRCRR